MPVSTSFTSFNSDAKRWRILSRHRGFGDAATHLDNRFLQRTESHDLN